MTITATDLRNKARIWKRYGDEALSVSNSALYHDAAAAFDKAANEITSLQVAIDKCVDGGTFDMVRDELKAMYRAYVVLLEAGRNRIIDHGGTCDPVDVMEEGDPALISARAIIAKLKS